MRIQLSFVFIAHSLGLAASASKPFVVVESIASPPAEFSKQNPAALSDQTLTLRLHLAHNDVAGLENELYEVSTPGNAKYGQHLSTAEVASYIAPSNETLSLVDSWLKENDLVPKPVSKAGDWLEISLPVSQANTLLNTQFDLYEDDSGARAIRTLSYSVPSQLDGHIHLIHPTILFPILPSGPRRMHKSPSNIAPASCSDNVTPTCLQDLYSIPSAPANDSTNSLYISAFIGEYAAPSDVDAFIAKYRPDMTAAGVNITFTVVSLNNGTETLGPDPGVEATLDMEYTIGLATGVPTTFVSVGPGLNQTTGGVFFDGLLDEAEYLLNLESPPVVLTTSYGFNETGISPAMANAICNVYMQLGARGTTVIFGSGDGGVSGLLPTGVDACIGQPFIPVFPATCPYVTTAGATQIVSGNTETAANFSSGGFSNIFPRPAYQSEAVATYLSKLGDTYSGLYNTSGRGFPDVAANGVNYTLWYEGEDGFLIYGTSCASPTFASIVSLVNDRLLSAGRPQLGFLNPMLYANPHLLTDILTGNNPGCGTDGFNATVGWDPITGLGTPNFTALAEAVGV